MSGFFDEGLAGVVATWMAALVTIGVWAYLVGERRFFRLAQHLLAGLGVQHLGVPLDPGEPGVDVLEGGDRGARGAGQRGEAGR